MRHRQSIEVNETEMKVLQLIKAGLSLRKIADETGISKSTVGNILKKHMNQVSNVHENTMGNGQLGSGQSTESTQEEYDEPTLL